jgi:hypothetical protein
LHRTKKGVDTLKVYYPPVGIAHITSQLCDLFADRLCKSTEVRIACISQPKADPHFGTMLVLFCCFALAKKIQETYSIHTTVLVDTLENSPAKEVLFNDITYSLCLSHLLISGKSAAEKYSESLIDLSSWASKRSGIGYDIRSYKEIQAQKNFRIGLTEILDNRSVFIPIVSPSEHELRIRPICLECGLVDKAAKTVKIERSASSFLISFICPNHGLSTFYLDDPCSIIDCNTPIRTILRSYCFSKERNTSNIETIVVNGSDWAGAWMQRVYFDGLANLGVVGLEVPFNLFTPLVLDETGAKLSKTIYLEKGAYSNIDEAWLSVPKFISKFGEKGLSLLWNEIESWIDSPNKFFREYSLSYFTHLFDYHQFDIGSY